LIYNVLFDNVTKGCKFTNFLRA